MHSAQVRYDIQRARQWGLTADPISVRFGVSPRSQRRIAHEEITFGMNDRDFRKQTIMTIRTLLLENTLRAFLVALLATLQTKVSLERVLSLLFERSGARMETLSQVVYWVNTTGLSLPNRRLLSEIVEGLCVMDLQDQGKPVHVRLKDMPP